ncbi:MAG: hypothetical protein HC848_10155 [Limnobacter sp.]|nr:hypothetical protein [Limnobacter sp.]
MFADNTDGQGLCTDLLHQLASLGLALRGAHVLMLGAGGAASGCLQALAQAGLAGLTILNRRPERARELAMRAQALGLPARGDKLECTMQDVLPKPPAVLVVVNATSSSLAGKAPPHRPRLVLQRQSGARYDVQQQAHCVYASSAGRRALSRQKATTFGGRWPGHAGRPSGPRF